MGLPGMGTHAGPPGPPVRFWGLGCPLGIALEASGHVGGPVLYDVMKGAVRCQRGDGDGESGGRKGGGFQGMARGAAGRQALCSASEDR
jgi:hypothetical protein